MTIKRKFETPDYREAMEKFAKYRQDTLTRCYLIYDYPTSTYTVEVTTTVDSEADFYRTILAGIATESQEEQTALAYADSAIKTLQELGVIK